ncbi:MAG: hypothetical protein HYV37_03995 [Candidatus Levyibacteriota bacterium]|nr:MAG: hypothetical protein HYV37_03995 [Candidatus Levybacteria bacterium]
MNTGIVKDVFDQNTFRLLYYKNKVYLLPFLLIALAIALVYLAVMPQINDYFSYLDEEKNIKERVNVVKSNTNTLLAVDETNLDEKLKVVSSALPAEKDFGGILRAIAQAATEANVVLGDFSFQIGELSASKTKVTNAYPIEISLSINGDIVSSKQFLRMLMERFPLSEATNINVSESTSTIKVLFYYKPYDSVNFDPGRQIQPLSQDQLSLLNQLAAFKLQ